MKKLESQTFGTIKTARTLLALMTILICSCSNSETDRRTGKIKDLIDMCVYLNHEVVLAEKDTVGDVWCLSRDSPRMRAAGGWAMARASTFLPSGEELDVWVRAGSTTGDDKVFTVTISRTINPGSDPIVSLNADFDSQGKVLEIERGRDEIIEKNIEFIEEGFDFAEQALSMEYKEGPFPWM